MTLNFPSSPLINDEHIFNGKTYKWNGFGWDIVFKSSTTQLEDSVDKRFVTDEQESKIDKINYTGSGNLFLSNDGTYKTAPDFSQGVVISGTDGYANNSIGRADELYSTSIQFTSEMVGKTISIFGGESIDDGDYTILALYDNDAILRVDSDFVVSGSGNHSNITFEIKMSEDINFTRDGSGKSFLSDDGTYKEVQAFSTAKYWALG
jgi:hypothetical protein